MENQTELSEIESEVISDANAQESEESFNSEPEIAEQEPLPWENAPENVYYYSHINDDGVIFDITESAEFAYSLGYFDNQISKDDVEVSDVNNWHYLKDKCPHKTQEMIDRENAIQEITQLKKQLSDTDYKAIKYAEGQLTEEEYSSTRSQRASWRARINKLQEDFNI